MTNSTPEVTYRGLHEWYEHAFKKVGWIVLAKKYGYNDKIKHFKHSIDRLHAAMEKKMRVLHEQDRKTDLHIMIEHVSILKKWLSTL